MSKAWNNNKKNLTKQYIFLSESLFSKNNVWSEIRILGKKDSGFQSPGKNTIRKSNHSEITIRGMYRILVTPVVSILLKKLKYNINVYRKSRA